MPIKRSPGKQSAGILLYRMIDGALEVFLVHPGGPFFKNKDDGSWSIPKGEFLMMKKRLQPLSGSLLRKLASQLMASLSG